MSRILLLAVFLIWLSWVPGPVHGHGHRVGHVGPESVALFFGGYALLVLGMGIWSRAVSRRLMGRDLQRSMRLISRVVSMARLGVPAWFAFGVCVLGWKEFVMRRMVHYAHGWPAELPFTLIGTFPAFAAWMGLWWSQYPADRALREQNLLVQLDNDLPVHAPPGFWDYFSSNVRLQLLFTIVPVMAIMCLRDLAAMGFYLFGRREIGEGAELIVSLVAAISIFVFAPAILKHVLHTEPLRELALREKLEAICRRHRLRYRDILLWRTNHNMGNAAVMGLIPEMRYILMSDLLLETMNDQQIESVFAHEVGHVVHRHLLWYVVFVIALMLGMFGPGHSVYEFVRSRLPGWVMGLDHGFLNMVLVAGAAGVFFLLLGFISRRFERQADVFAARTMQNREQGTGDSGQGTTVGTYGADVFASALHRVAAINNIPVSSRRWPGGTLLQFVSFFFDRALDSANNFLHGSITYRTDFLQKLAQRPELTRRFDRGMRWIYGALLLVLVGSAAWCVLI